MDTPCGRPSGHRGRVGASRNGRARTAGAFCTLQGKNLQAWCHTLWRDTASVQLR